MQNLPVPLWAEEGLAEMDELCQALRDTPPGIEYDQLRQKAREAADFYRDLATDLEQAVRAYDQMVDPSQHIAGLLRAAIKRRMPASKQTGAAEKTDSIHKASQPIAAANVKSQGPPTGAKQEKESTSANQNLSKKMPIIRALL